MLYSIPATREIISYVLENLRQEDKKEMVIEFGNHWKEIIFCRAVQSEIYGIVDEKEKILGFFGIKGINEKYAQVCLLSTDDLSKQGFIFLKKAKRIVAEWNKRYSTLYNFVYKENKQAIKWLRWLGFTLSEIDNDRMYFYKVCD